MAREKRVYSVYVVELDCEVCSHPDFLAQEGVPLYVGETGLTPEERFAEHKAGRRAAKHVRKHGLWLRPDLFEGWGPYLVRCEAEEAEPRLAEHLRARGFSVHAGKPQAPRDG